VSDPINALGITVGVYAVFVSVVLPEIQSQVNKDPLLYPNRQVRTVHLRKNRSLMLTRISVLTIVTTLLVLLSSYTLAVSIDGFSIPGVLTASAATIMTMWLLGTVLYYGYKLLRQNKIIIESL
jgi:sterol desaturase/sphingolipid hydroxylase (fatty acid hydroxylase superfamily)